ncbi:hypothetical protein RUM43_014631 [Polyplax serrata]|uniref:NSFL1 cofactor p47 n=1 Tax=Polyplax serrata TaxID=468196 RepID=A0AAN8PIB7_POLSC
MSQHQDNQQLVSSFADVTGVDSDQARVYLEAAAWQLEGALMNFYDNQEDERQQNQNSNDNEVQEITASDAPPRNRHLETSSASAIPRGGITNSRFATISSLNKDASSDEEEGQAFYAGGSEHSGQQVLGPGKKKNSIVAEMFKSAQEHGAEVLDSHSQGSSKKKNTFTGLGYRLGQSNNDSEVIGIPNNTPSSSSNKEVNVTLKMWQDGFSINDGPLRQYSDPSTREFLSVVSRGEIPGELLKEAKGNEVHLNMEDHSHEEFVAVKPKLKAFSGKGSVLGSPTPNSVMAPTSTSDQDRNTNEEKAKSLLSVNTAEPTTTIQIRLADGSRLAATLNHTHTVAELREFIKIARPEYCGRGFKLMTTFPNRDLEDDKTLVDAGILNSAIMQRLT